MDNLPIGQTQLSAMIVAIGLTDELSETGILQKQNWNISAKSSVQIGTAFASLFGL